MKLSTDDYTVAVICALEIELFAVRGMLDVPHDPLNLPGDETLYIYGEINEHNVVVACLPEQTGKGAAAIVATNLSRTFRSIQCRLLVGIGGGVPSLKHGIRLGDVVVSMPEGQHGGVVQYDLGKETKDGFIRKGFLYSPPAFMRNAVITMKSDHRYSTTNGISQHLEAFKLRNSRLNDFERPESTSAHERGLLIHYGLIALGHTVIKTRKGRYELVQSLGDVLCVEMEAAGISTSYVYLVIRGISDLADENKNDDWHGAAALAAAACMKELLGRVPAAQENYVLERGGPDPTSSNQPRSAASTYNSVQHGNGYQQVGSGNVFISGTGNSFR